MVFVGWFNAFFKKYVALDHNLSRITQAKKITHSLYENLTFIADDIIELNITEKFDVIIAKNVIHYARDKINIAFDNIFRVLNDDGIIIISEPAITPYNWNDDTLNENSDTFDKLRWNKKKKKNWKMHIII